MQLMYEFPIAIGDNCQNTIPGSADSPSTLFSVDGGDQYISLFQSMGLNKINLIVYGQFKCEFLMQL